MENAVDALQLGFAILVFMMACGMLFSTVSLAMEVTSDIIKNADKSEYYEYLENDPANRKVDNAGNRIVTMEDIIPTLYRYSSESYAVTIIDQGNIIARFDTTTETACQKWGILDYNSKESLRNEINNYVLKPAGIRLLANVDELQDLFERIYGQNPTLNYTENYGCHWMGNDAFIAQRIDSDLSRNNCIF